MGCGCSLFDQIVAAPPTSVERTMGNAKSRCNEIEFSVLPIMAIDSEAKSVYRPPPPDWALDGDGIERRADNKHHGRDAVNGASAGPRRHPLLQLLREAKAAAIASGQTLDQVVGHTTENGEVQQQEAEKAEVSVSASSEDTVRDGNIISELTEDSASDHKSEDAAKSIGSKDVVDALSRPASVQCIPATLSDPGPMTVESSGLEQTERRFSKRRSQFRQMALDGSTGIYCGKYSTLV